MIIITQKCRNLFTRRKKGNFPSSERYVKEAADESYLSQKLACKNLMSFRINNLFSHLPLPHRWTRYMTLVLLPWPNFFLERP